MKTADIIAMKDQSEKDEESVAEKMKDMDVPPDSRRDLRLAESYVKNFI